MFHTNPMSRGRIVRWMLEELGVGYRTVLQDYGAGMKSPEYLAINPMGKVPSLQHRGVVVTEAAAICAYLADAFPQAGLAPAIDDPLRGPYFRWLFFAAGPVEAAVTARAMGLLAPPEKAGMVGYGSFEQTVDALELAAASASPWLLGERFSAADVYVGGQVDFGLAFGSIPERPAFSEWAGRLRGREGYRRARALDDALLPPGIRRRRVNRASMAPGRLADAGRMRALGQGHELHPPGSVFAAAPVRRPSGGVAHPLGGVARTTGHDHREIGALVRRGLGVQQLARWREARLLAIRPRKSGPARPTTARNAAARLATSTRRAGSAR